MFKLINAGFYRLRKSKIFWGMIIATILITVITYYILNTDIIHIDGVKLEKNFVSTLSFISFIIAAFITLFNNSEFSERNDKK